MIGIFDISYSLWIVRYLRVFAVFAAIKFQQPISESFRSFYLSGAYLSGNIVVGDDGLGLGTSGRCSHFQYIQNVSSFLAQLDLKSHSVREYGFGKLSQFLDMEH